MRVLVVDDSFTARRLLLNMLRSHRVPITHVVEAADGLDALARIGDDPPDLILCDYTMPRMDGLKFAHALRRRYDSTRVKVVMVTARAAEYLEEKARQAGVDAILGKPVNEEELLATLETLVGPQT